MVFDIAINDGSLPQHVTQELVFPMCQEKNIKVKLFCQKYQITKKRDAARIPMSYRYSETAFIH